MEGEMDQRLLLRKKKRTFIAIDSYPEKINAYIKAFVRMLAGRAILLIKVDRVPRLLNDMGVPERSIGL